MKLSPNNKTTIDLSIVGISVLAWVVLLFNPGHIMGVQHCCVSDAGPSARSLKMLLDMNPISGLLTGWGLMVIAMMLPKLISPVQQIVAQSFRKLRFPLALLFVLGYITVWMIAGVFMIAAILGLHLLLPNSWLPAIGLGIVALVWQFSPVKQLCLNRGHNHAVMPAFGWPALRGSFQFGIIHGIWCAGADWALMLWPMILPQGHNIAMLLVTLIMLSEHAEHPQAPRWRINFRGKLFRYIIAQIQIRLSKSEVLN